MVDKSKLYEQTKDLIFSDGATSGLTTSGVRVLQKTKSNQESDGKDELAPLRFVKRQAEQFLIQNSDAPFTIEELALQLIQGLEQDDQNVLAETLAFDFDMVEKLYAKKGDILTSWKKARDQFGSAKRAGEAEGK